MIFALVDETGTVYVADGAASYAEVAKAHGVDEQACARYRFALAQRRLVQDHGSLASQSFARAYFNRHLGSPEKLMAFAKQGRLAKQSLASLLPIPDRRAFLDSCAALERRYTETCAGDPCLETGCSMDEGERCLQPLLRGDVEYRRACAAAWAESFARVGHRIAAWQH